MASYTMETFLHLEDLMQRANIQHKLELTLRPDDYYRVLTFVRNDLDRSELHQASILNSYGDQFEVHGIIVKCRK